MDDLLTLPRTLKNGEVLPCAVRKLDSFDIFWVIPFKYFSPVELAQILHIKNQFAWHHQDFPPSSNDLCLLWLWKSLLKRLAKKLANGIKNYHKQTDTNNLNLANDRPHVMIHLVH